MHWQCVTQTARAPSPPRPSHSGGFFQGDPPPQQPLLARGHVPRRRDSFPAAGCEASGLQAHPRLICTMALGGQTAREILSTPRGAAFISSSSRNVDRRCNAALAAGHGVRETDIAEMKGMLSTRTSAGCVLATPPATLGRESTAEMNGSCVSGAGGFQLSGAARTKVPWLSTHRRGYTK